MSKNPLLILYNLRNSDINELGPRYLFNNRGPFEIGWMVLYHVSVYLTNYDEFLEHRKIQGSAALEIQYPGAQQEDGIILEKVEN